MNDARLALRAPTPIIEMPTSARTGPIARTNPPGAPTRSSATIVASPMANIAPAKSAGPWIRLGRLFQDITSSQVEGVRGPPTGFSATEPMLAGSLADRVRSKVVQSGGA